jgi:F-box-like
MTELDGGMVSGQSYSRMIIDAIPDDVLLEIFNLFVDDYEAHSPTEDAWHMLAHTCQRWRDLVFASPCRLNLRLLCTVTRPVRRMLNIWPALPIVIIVHVRKLQQCMMGDIIAALEQHNRVCEIYIEDIPNQLLTKFAAMSEPFPVLTNLGLWSFNAGVPVLPDSFLGGSAPRLEKLVLHGIPFPALPELLLSTSNLVKLDLRGIPLSGYISPEAMVTGLSALSSLQDFRLEFLYPLSQENRENRLLPRLKRAVLPALTSFHFKGDSEYLEDIIAQIDTPLLDRFHVSFFNQLIFHTPFLRHFISRTETFKVSHQADIRFCPDHVEVTLRRPDRMDKQGTLSLEISCGPSDWQLSSLAQICDSALSPLPTLEHLEIYDDRGHWESNTDNSQWLEVSHPFALVKDLFLLYGELFRLVAPALEELPGRSVTEVLPALERLFILDSQSSEPVTKAIEKFIALRRLSGRPVVVYRGDGWFPTYVNWEIVDQ